MTDRAAIAERYAPKASETSSGQARRGEAWQGGARQGRAGFSQKLLVDVRDVAELLSISERTVWRLVGSNEIPCLRLGSRVLFSVAAVAQWIEEQTTKAET